MRHCSEMIALSEINRLAPEEKFQLVAAIWDSFAENPDDLSIGEEELRLLKERDAELETGKSMGLSIDEFRRRL
jgi:putative addiction module component (TIGR02574 family)